MGAHIIHNEKKWQIKIQESFFIRLNSNYTVRRRLAPDQSIKQYCKIAKTKKQSNMRF